MLLQLPPLTPPLSLMWKVVAEATGKSMCVLSFAA
jgi:hypothetical protein